MLFGAGLDVAFGASASADPSGADWVQVGLDIDGKEVGDYAGESVAMSADGATVIIGAPRVYGGDAGAGMAWVYDHIGGTWLQRGSDIDGEAIGDRFGSSVAMSADGNTVIIGALYNDGGGVDAGHARVFGWDRGSAVWVQRGADIDGEAAGDLSGEAVAMSAGGNIIAIGAPGNDDTGNIAGHARVFKWVSDGNDWVQRGTDIDGERSDNLGGSAVALSADGNTVAVGAQTNPGSFGGYATGHVRVHNWDTNAADWVQRGTDIDGEAAFDRSGAAVAVSADGNSVAIGALQNAGTVANGDNGDNGPGHVRVYDWAGDSGGWVQRGADIDGEAGRGGERSGTSVAMSADGSTVAIGAPRNESSNGDTGHARVLRLQRPFICAIDGADLSWTDFQRNKYWVYRSIDDGATYNWLGRTLGGTSFTDVAPVDGALYQVHFAGIARIACSSTDAAPVASPFSCASNAGVLTWTDFQQNKYWVYRSIDGGATYAWLGRTLGTPTFTDVAPAEGATYQVHFVGVARTECTITAEPDGGGVFACVVDGATLTWTDLGIEKYWIYRSVDDGATYNWIGRTQGSPAATTFIDLAPVEGAMYQLHHPGPNVPRTDCS